MSKVWRFVLYLAAALVIAGVVLLGAAWVTGASIHRIVELVFGGQAELDAWLREGWQRAQTVWDNTVRFLQSIVH